MSTRLRSFLGTVRCGVVAVTLGSAILCYSADRKLKVVRVSLNQDIVNVTGELDGKSASLMCLRTVPECEILEPGIFLLVQALPETSAYNDCQNVYLYSHNGTVDRGQKIGLYCLLSPDLQQPNK